ncbi:PREDICTED: uncharacterized protein LOC108369768 isoform X1 [Rhagoletis zephyria]|uniref:uncharacterized protein LOC108369768 isoform X1 n=1 Tax=Rhagoletis zephyria TaxID=28612 RepID=UPI0008112332|nr:PREDICTED: uncharacterized protein LOC108369768 isoform X1 [Rhagoletis zephyria]
MLLDKMLQKPDISRGFAKENRDKVAEFWRQLTLSLNSVGTPVKSEFEWKKVWTDQKRYVRKKASQDKMYERGTGGGPNKTQKFSSAEEAIFQLLGMKESVDGIESSQCYGLPSKRVKVNSDAEVLSEIIVQCEEAPGCSTDFPTSIQDSEPPVPQCQSECSPKDSSKQGVLQSSQNTNSTIKSKKN